MLYRPERFRSSQPTKASLHYTHLSEYLIRHPGTLKDRWLSRYVQVLNRITSLRCGLIAIFQKGKQRSDSNDADTDGRSVESGRSSEEVGRNPFDDTRYVVGPNPFDDSHEIVDSPTVGGNTSDNSITEGFSMVQGNSGVQGASNLASSSREALLRPGVLVVGRDYPLSSGKTSTKKGPETETDREPSRDAIQTIKEGLKNTSPFKLNADLYVRFTIPFDPTGKDEALKIVGSQGVERFTAKQCTSSEGIETIYSRLRSNLPLMRPDKEIPTIQLRLKFRLTQLWRTKECREDSFKCFDILLGSGLRFYWKDKFDVELGHEITEDLEEVLREVSRVRRELLGVGKAQTVYHQKGKATSGIEFGFRM